MKVFGCRAYYYISNNARNKLESRAKRGIFVGYSQGTRAYRIYDPQDKKIHAIRTAKFDENQMGSGWQQANAEYTHTHDQLAYRYGNDSEDEEEELITSSREEDAEQGEAENEEIGDRRNEIEGINEEEPACREKTRTPGRKAGVAMREIQEKHRNDLR